MIIFYFFKPLLLNKQFNCKSKNQKYLVVKRSEAFFLFL